MKNWQKTVEKFITPWKKKKYVEGIMMTGSYVHGTQTPRSDIDFHIVLSDEIKWRERGNKFVDGILMEYFANPLRQIYKYFETDYKDHRKVDARMFSAGRILYDQRGVMKELKKFGQKELKRKYKKPDKTRIEIIKYGLWDRLDNLRDAYSDKRISFDFLYNLLLLSTLEQYAEFLQADIVKGKVDKFFTNASFRKRYLVKKFPNDKFSVLFIDCLQAKTRKDKFEAAQKIINHVLLQMGGFEIDGWKVRTKIR